MARYEMQCSKVGSFSYAGNFKLYIDMNETDVEVGNNRSKVNYNVYCQSSGSGSINASHFRYFSINGSEKINTTGTVSASSPNANIPIASGTTDYITHNSDGSKSISFVAEIRASSYGVSARIEDTFTLTTIPRASSVTATSANIEESITININKAVDYFTHTITYSFKGLSGTIATKTSNSSVGYTLPASWYNQIPDEKSSWGTITCYTYNGDAHIGTTTCTFNVYTNEAKCKPTISRTLALYDASRTDTLTPAQTKTLTGCTDASPKYITKYSPMSVTANATAKNGAKIKQIIIAGTTYTKDATTTSQEMKFAKPSGNPDIVAVDSRGYRTTIMLDATYVNYIPFTLNANIVRKGPTESEVYLTFTGNLFTGSFGSQTNALTYFLIQYKESGTSTWTNGKNSLTLNTDYSLSNNQIKSLKNISLGTSFDYNKSYDFKLTMRDRLGTVSEVVIQKPVAKGKPIINWGEDFFNVNGDIYKNSEEEILAYTELFSNSSGTNGTVTLSESAANFDYIEVFYRTRYNHYKSVKIASPNGKVVLLDAFHIFGSYSHVGVFISKIITINGDTITSSGNDAYGEWWTNASSGTDVKVENNIYIVKVVGYK